jgi:multiple sugar transport system substrate-binding protein
VRAELYNEAIDAFNEEYPNITVNPTFRASPEFWGEAPDRGGRWRTCPTCMQFDYSYLRQYSENNLLLDLDPYLGNIIETDPLPEKHPRHRRGRRHHLRHHAPPRTRGACSRTPSSSSRPASRSSRRQLGRLHRLDGRGHRFRRRRRSTGGTDFTGRIQNFELQLRSKARTSSAKDGEPGFDEERLTEFWESGADARDGIGIPQQRSRRSSPRAASTRAHGERAHVGQLRRGYLGASARATPSSV